MRTAVLILGGTAEAVALARALSSDSRLSVTTSLAGRTRLPAPVPGEVRIGGFGGAEGLARYLRENAIRLLLDATHPYASAISHHAAQACARTGVDRLQLLRPPWLPRAGDRWIRVDSARASAGKVRRGQRVFLTTGRNDLPVYAAMTDAWFLIRLVEPADRNELPPQCEVHVARGPFDLESEIALLRNHRIDLLISKNSGGDPTYAKIAAARHLQVPVVLLDRPRAACGPTVPDVAAATAWVEQRADAMSRPD